MPVVVYPKELKPGDVEYEMFAASIWSSFHDGSNLISIYISRPGFAELTFSSATKPRYHRRVHYCEKCYEMFRLMDYMVKKEIWDRYAMGHNILCLDCLQELMGSKLTVSDFPDVPVNAEIHFGYNMAYETIDKEG